MDDEKVVGGDRANSFCDRLVAYHVARLGYRHDFPPEAAPLAAACDAVLVDDRSGLSILCFVDCSRDPARNFDLSPEHVLGIARQCRRYTTHVNGTAAPTSIDIIEVVNGPLDDVHISRLNRYRGSRLSRVNVNGTLIDAGSGKFWSNQTAVAREGLRTLIQWIPREAPAFVPPSAPSRVVMPPGRFPIVTVGILTLLVCCFALEIILAIGPVRPKLEPSNETLIAVGGMVPTYVLQRGEWYRLLTGIFLHVDMVHLLANCVVLYIAGSALENLVGRRWLVTLFVFGGITGSLVSLAWYAGTVIVVVGSSGAIMGLLTAASFLALRMPPGARRLRVQLTMLGLLVVSMIPVGAGTLGEGVTVDLAGHIGGMAGGAILGLMLLKYWPAGAPVPNGAQRALWLPGLTLAGLAVGIAQLGPVHGLFRQLAPTAELQTVVNDQGRGATDLASRYPRDPRAHMLHGLALLRQPDLVGAERALRAGLAEEKILRRVLDPVVEGTLRLSLAHILYDAGRQIEAREQIGPVCNGLGPTQLRQRAQQFKLCD